MKAKIFKAPEEITLNGNKSIFLAGTIDIEGKSEDWQRAISKVIDATCPVNINIFNPRRDHWDSSTKQSIDDPNFTKQVVWELDQMDMADYIIINFLPDSKSPISLLEFGRYADSGKLIVCCPKEFYRNGNIEVVCERFNIPLYRDLNGVITHLYEKLKK